MKCHSLKVILAFHRHCLQSKVSRHRICINNCKEILKFKFFPHNTTWQIVPYKINWTFLLMCVSKNHLQIRQCELQASCLSPCGWGSSPCHQCQNWFWLGCWRQRGTCQLCREFPATQLHDQNQEKIGLSIPLFFSSGKENFDQTSDKLYVLCT